MGNQAKPRRTLII